LLLADLYYARIDVRRHLPQPGPECLSCDAASCRSFAERLGSGRLAEEARRGPLPPETCPFLTADRLDAFRIALAPDVVLPSIEVSQIPRPSDPGLVSTGNPRPETPVLLSANHEGTVAFVSALLALTSTPLHYLIADTRGDSVDMAMIHGSLTLGVVLAALHASGIDPSNAGRLILPGFAAPLAADVAARSGWRTTAGPVCGAEIPLFLGDAWRLAGRAEFR